jgi:superfamily II DNA or RNA helicase
MVKDDRRSIGEPMSELEFKGVLRDSQKDATSKVMSQLTQLGGAMLVLPCGFGKTVCSIWVLVQLKRKALVLVHTGALADQWVERINTFLPGVRVGRIQRDVVDVDGCDVVVGMVQSLAKRVYDRAVLSSFGTVVVDEAHHIAAPWFTGALRKLPARFVLGLSATPDRKDGLGVILPWVLGPIAYRATREAEIVDVNMVEYIDLPNQVELTDRRGKPRYSEMLTTLSVNTPRNRRIVRCIVEHVTNGRSLIVLSERRDQLVELEQLLLEEEGAVSVTNAPPRKRRRKTDPVPPLCPPPSDSKIVVARVMGGTRADLREHGFAHSTVLLSTYPYAAEGIDIPRLDTLIMASPGINVEQTVGRILRRHPNKKCPLVVDIKDPFSLFDCMGWKRFRYYRSQNYNVINTTWDASLKCDSKK